MSAASKIRKALKNIMSEGEANACRVEKGFLYDGSQQRNGWHFTRFNSTPTFLGSNESEAWKPSSKFRKSVIIIAN
jgi:hypothetical protein